MNECYSLFVSKFGEPTQKESVPEEDWIAEIPELSNFDYVVFARGAFGSLYPWCIQTGHIVNLKCARVSAAA